MEGCSSTSDEVRTLSGSMSPALKSSPDLHPCKPGLKFRAALLRCRSPTAAAGILSFGNVLNYMDRYTVAGKSPVFCFVFFHSLCLIEEGKGWNNCAYLSAPCRSDWRLRALIGCEPLRAGSSPQLRGAEQWVCPSAVDDRGCKVLSWTVLTTCPLC